MTAKDYLTALKVIREIQRKQAYCCGQSKAAFDETGGFDEATLMIIFTISFFMVQR